MSLRLSPPRVPPPAGARRLLEGIELAPWIDDHGPPQPQESLAWSLTKTRVGWFERMRSLRWYGDPSALLDETFRRSMHDLLRSKTAVVSWAAPNLLIAMTYEERGVLRLIAADDEHQDQLSGHLLLVEEGSFMGLLDADDEIVRARAKPPDRLMRRIETDQDRLIITYARDEDHLVKLTEQLPKLLAQFPPFAGHTHVLLDAALTPMTEAMQALVARTAASYPDPGLTFGWSTETFCSRPEVVLAASEVEVPELRVLQLDQERLIYVSAEYEGALLALGDTLHLLIRNLGAFTGHTHVLVEADTTPQTEMMRSVVANVAARHARASFSFGWSNERFCDRE